MKAIILIALALIVQNVTAKRLYPTPTTRDHKNNLKRKPEAKLVLTAAAEKVPSVSLNALELCLCGAVSTMIGDFVMHPIDTIKVVQQTSAQSIGFLSAANAIVTAKGLLGFFPGVIPYLACDGISGAIKFASFELSKKYVEARVPEKFYPVTQFVCAAGAMLACSLTLVPGEVLKIRLQSGLVKSLTEGIVDIFKTDGWKGFYAGYSATLIRDVPFTML
jgi:hypothetical protein